MKAPFDDVDEERRGEQVPEELVQERRVIGRLIDRCERPVGRVDLEAPGQVGRLSEELLVPPVADPPHRLRHEQAWRETVGEEPYVRAGPLRDEASDETTRAIPPQTPSPPFQIANGPHHWSGTSFQLVARW